MDPWYTDIVTFLGALVTFIKAQPELLALMLATPVAGVALYFYKKVKGR